MNSPEQTSRFGADHRTLPRLPEIARRRYTDEDFYQAELTHVWRKSWLLAGHISEFLKEGDYRQLDIPFAPVVVVRGKDGELRAFLNSCRHRGATLLREKTGSARVLSCQYHGWTYNLEGKLIGVPESAGFPDLNPDDYTLESIRCERFGGFIYINFDAAAPPLLDWLGPIATRHGVLAAAPMRIVTRQSFEVNCNWKIAAEAFRESYHINLVHRNTAALGLVGEKACYEMYASGHGTMIIPFRANLSQVDWEGMVANSQLTILPGAQGEDFRRGVVQISVFPNTAFGLQPQGFPVFLAWPLAVDRCRLEFIYFAGDWGDAPRPAELDGVVAALETLTAEDIANMASIQQSVAANPNLGIPLSTQECLIYLMHTEINRLIGADGIPAKLRVPDILEKYIVA